MDEKSFIKLDSGITRLSILGKKVFYNLFKDFDFLVLRLFEYFKPIMSYKQFLNQAMEQSCKTSYGRNLRMDFHNKLKCLSLASLSSLV